MSLYANAMICCKRPVRVLLRDYSRMGLCAGREGAMRAEQRREGGGRAGLCEERRHGRRRVVEGGRKEIGATKTAKKAEEGKEGKKEGRREGRGGEKGRAARKGCGRSREAGVPGGRAGREAGEGGTRKRRRARDRGASEQGLRGTRFPPTKACYSPEGPGVRCEGRSRLQIISQQPYFETRWLPLATTLALIREEGFLHRHRRDTVAHLLDALDTHC